MKLRLVYRFSIFFVGAVLTASIVVGSEENGSGLEPPYHVGYRVVDFDYQKAGEPQTLTVAIWYPTAEQPRTYTYGGPTDGKVAVDAAPQVENGPYPLLIFSHGYGGSGLSAVFFTEVLAAHGWIVVCPDHHDEQSSVRVRTGQQDFDRFGLRRSVKEIAASDPHRRGKYLYRLDEMKLVMHRLLKSEQMGPLIDRRRMAVGGHSFGGFTALGVAGAIEHRHKQRIKAILLFSSGAGGYLFTDEELAAVRIPSMLFIGERERRQRRGSNTMLELSAKIYSNFSPPKYFVEIQDGNHFSFNNRFEDNARNKLLSGTDEQYDVIRRYAIAFLQHHVVGEPGFEQVLQQRDSRLSQFKSKSALVASE